MDESTLTNSENDSFYSKDTLNTVSDTETPEVEGFDYSLPKLISSISNVSLNPTEKCEILSINPSHLFIYLSIVDSKLILTSTLTLALPSNTPLL